MRERATSYVRNKKCQVIRLPCKLEIRNMTGTLPIKTSCTDFELGGYYVLWLSRKFEEERTLRPQKQGFGGSSSLTDQFSIIIWAFFLTAPPYVLL